MDFLLTKLLPVAVYPLGLALLLLVLALLASLTRRKRGARILIVLPFALLWSASTPVVANWLIGTLEGRQPALAPAEAPESDVIVLLGGLAWSAPAAGNPVDFTDAVDRAIVAARLHRDGKAPTILVSGGNLPWADAGRAEAALIADLLVELGVPRDALVLETGSRNTHENAVNSAPLFAANGWEEGLLVTSAWHMPRAQAVFEAAGLDLTPVAADARQRAPLGNALDYLPQAEALATTTVAVKEWLGMAVYRLRGWL